MKRKPVRRFRGIVLDTTGKSWKVAFIHNGEIIEYELPAEGLHRKGIRLPLQPFEMTEMQSGYKFRPLAVADDVKLEVIDLPDEYRELRDLILAKLGGRNRMIPHSYQSVRLVTPADMRF